MVYEIKINALIITEKLGKVFKILNYFFQNLLKTTRPYEFD